MFGFGTKRKQEVDPLTAEQNRLKARFAQAVFGGTAFRTLTFAPADGGMDRREWREAIKVPGDGWRIIWKAQIQTLADAIDQKTEIRSLTFYDAAERLARYEACLRSLGATPIDEAEATALGERYVRTFAEREGLVFDSDGVIHPTLNGQILADSLFPPDAHEKAAHAWTMRQQAGLEAMEIGELIQGKGVFLGLWSPKDRDGNSLNKTFNLFAAPYDLGLDENGRGTNLVTTYNEAVAAVGKITNLMGHAGFKGKNDTDLYKALRYGSYQGEWFMPTRDILHGKDRDDNAVQDDHLFGHRNTGALAGTFTTAASGSINAHWYWSCTEHFVNPSYVYDVRFTCGGGDWGHKENFMSRAE